MLAVLAFAVAAAGCGSANDLTNPVQQPSDLVGSWHTDRESVAPSGSYQTTLSFTADGHYTYEERWYGIYSGEPADEVSAYSRVTGTFNASNGALTDHPAQLVWWDRAEGASAAEHTQTANADDNVFPDGHYSISGTQLTLQFTGDPGEGTLTAVFTKT